MADGLVGLLVLHGRHVAAPALDHELDLELALGVEVRDVQAGVVHLDAGGRGDVGCRDLAGTLLAHVHHDRLVVVRRHDEVLDVEDQLRDVLSNTGNGGELVQHAVDADARHRCAGDGRQQGATKRVAKRVAKAWLEGLEDEARAVLGDGLFGEGGPLCDEHGCVLSWRPPYDAVVWCPPPSGRIGGA